MRNTLAVLLLNAAVVSTVLAQIQPAADAPQPMPAVLPVTTFSIFVREFSSIDLARRRC